MPDAQELADRWYVKHGPCCAGSAAHRAKETAMASRRSRQRGEKRDRWKEPAEPNPQARH